MASPSHSAQRRETLNIRIPVTERNLIDRAAQSSGKTRTDFILEAARRAARFTRGVALMHDFWYPEAQRQFEEIAKADPDCAMAHWGVAMSLFHQIWDRPDAATVVHGWREMRAAQAHPAKTARERGYVAALGGFYQPDQRDYRSRSARGSSSHLLGAHRGRGALASTAESSGQSA